MTKLIDITDADLAALTGFEVTPEEVAEELRAAGIPAEVLWAHGSMGEVEAHGRGGVQIIVERGRAFISRTSKARLGHGGARLPSHPLYPAPIVSSVCAEIEAVLATIAD